MSLAQGRLAGLNALITGAGRGIGAGIATRFANEGAAVVLNARTESDLTQLQHTIIAGGGQAWVAPADIGTANGVQQVLNACADGPGCIDILVHNAGIYPLALIEELTDATWQHTLDVNLTSAFRLTRGLAPGMRERRFGRLLFTSSVTGNRVVVPGAAHYAASKAGMNGFIRAAALEFAADGVTVNGVEPGLVETHGALLITTVDERAAMAQYVPMKRWGQPEDVAGAMVYFASRDAGYVTGQTLVVDGGALLPENGAVMHSHPWSKPRRQAAT